MKTSKFFLLAEKSRTEKTPAKAGIGKLLKLTLVIFMLLWITFLSSCFVSITEHGKGGSMYGHPGHGGRHAPSASHGNGGRHH